jgi:hypothetical protein
MIWLWLYLTIPSLNEVQKYLGWSGVAIYLGIVAAVLLLASKFQLAARLARHVSLRQAARLAMATLFAVTALFVAIYPIAQSLALGPGSDGDDSVNIAVTELLHGRYPYSVHTYLQNPVHEMPGMLVLAAPFVLLGNSAYMNLFCLAAFFAILARELGDTRRALLALWMILALCPEVMQQIVTGSDSLANSILVAVSLWLLVHANSRGLRTTTAVLLGLALSSHANFLLVIPTAFGYTARKSGWPRAVYDLGIAGITFLAVTLPFYLYNPAQFTPLQAADRLTRFNEMVPYLGEAIGIAALLLALWLGWRSNLLFPSCALVQGFFVGTGTLLSRDVQYSAYGVFFLFFAMLYPWKVLNPTTGTRKPTD